MADIRLRAAERAWQTEGTYNAWVTYLREAKRAGKPLFTALDIMDVAAAKRNVEAAAPGGFRLTDFQHTEDGFIAQVIGAYNPPVERIYRIPLGYGEYDQESVPIWTWWSGKVILKWEESWGPGLELLVEACDLEAAYYAMPYPMPGEIIGEHIYEGFSVTNREELSDAFRDWDNWLFNE